MAHEFLMTEDDTAGPDVSPLEDLSELHLLTAGPAIGPVDRPIKDPRFPELWTTHD